GLYGLYGYAVLAHEGKDISPSITWLIKMGPKKIIYKNVPDEYKTLITEVDLPQTCYSVVFVYTTFAINHGGFVDSACIPNTEVPDDTTKCADGINVIDFQVRICRTVTNWAYYMHNQLVNCLRLSIRIIY
ncbi:MAG: hypothetical protein EZS28_047663, partial [Streblomastix strix]